MEHSATMHGSLKTVQRALVDTYRDEGCMEGQHLEGGAGEQRPVCEVDNRDHLAIG